MLCGRILDRQGGTALPGATVVVLGTESGALADEEGRFCLEGLPPGSYDLLVSFVGYEARKLRDVEAGSGRDMQISLRRSSIELPSLVVSATRRRQAFIEAPLSLSVANSGDIAAHNSFTLQAPLRYQPGVSMVGSQVNIRGSSGYSRGTGSRVLLLLDGFPMLSADLGDIKWRAIPVGEVERLEVIKGSGSALYGTGALGGVINVITRQPSADPRTRFRLLGGLYSQPAHESWRWTDDPMYLTGMDWSHNRRLGRTGALVSAGYKRSSGYHENDDFRRYHLFAKAVHHFAPGTYWSNLVNWSVDDHGVFLRWKNRLEPLKVPAKDRDASTVSWNLYLNSEFYRLHNRSLGYRLKGFYYRTAFDNTRSAGGFESAGHKTGGEVQVDYTGWKPAALTAGTSAAYDIVRSPGDFLGRRSLLNLAFYSHGVYSLLPQAEISVGLRYDLHRREPGGQSAMESPCPPSSNRDIRLLQRQFSPQVGLSYRFGSGTALRASAGRGFRAPSVAEIHTQAAASGLLVCPNPGLLAEHNWSSELGVRQLFADFLALDLALFRNTFEDLIEARPNPLPDAAAAAASFRNISRARIRGLEVEGQLALPHGLRWRTAFTYLDAVEFLDPDEILPPYCRKDLVPGEEAPLPYRFRHQLTTGIAATGRGNRMGATLRYLSRFERVSGLFPECRRDHRPIYLADAFVGRRWGPLEVNLRVDNLLQYHYVLTERKIRPMRRFSLALSGVI